MRKVIYGIVIFLITIIAFNIDYPLSDSEISGQYVNTNYQNKPCCVEAPHVSDTLELFSDNTFISGFYGRGTYKIYRGLSTKIILTYDYEMGKGSYYTSFTNEIFEKPRIILNSDTNHYYEKID